LTAVEGVVINSSECDN